MNRVIRLTASILTTLVIGTASAAEEELRLYNWGDYINPDILKAFTKETGIKVGLDTYTSNEEMLAKLQAGAKGYDIVFPSVHMQNIMHKLNMLEKTDINQAENWKHIDPLTLRASSDPKGEYCVPYGWGSVGIFYNKTKVKNDIKSWEDFFAIPEKSGEKITMLDDMREVLSVGLVSTGASVNSTDADELKKATDFILKQKPNISAFTYSVPGMLSSGDIAAAQFFVGLTAMSTQNPDLEYIIPSEGATLYQENMCVLASAPNKENAKKFMEFFLRPEISVQNTSQQFNGSANIAARALLPEVIKADPNITPNEDTLKRLEMLQDLGRGLKAYDRAWNTIRTAQ